MSLLRKGSTAVATACVILGLGYLVQSGSGPDQRAVRKATQPPANAVNSVMMTTNTSGAAVFGMPHVSGSPPPIENIQNVAAIDTKFAEVETPQQVFMPGSPLDGCVTDLSAALELAAMVELTLSSPCHAEADFVVWHGRMAFSGQTDSDGGAVIKTPALETNATFIVTFDNVEEARATVAVPDVHLYDRAVLQWRGTDNLQLHALEFGAGIGDPGHIWSASTQNSELTRRGQRGFMMRLGTSKADLPYWAEVYTFPSGLMNRDGHIALQVGAAVTERNCGRELDAVGIQTNSGQLLISQNLAIEMLGCDAVGQSVLRADIFENLTRAVH